MQELYKFKQINAEITESQESCFVKQYFSYMKYSFIVQHDYITSIKTIILEKPFLTKQASNIVHLMYYYAIIDEDFNNQFNNFKLTEEFTQNYKKLKNLEETI